MRIKIQLCLRSSANFRGRNLVISHEGARFPHTDLVLRSVGHENLSCLKKESCLFEIDS